MRRREFIIALSATVLVRPGAAYALQPDRTRRIGVILAYTEDNPNVKPRLAAFVQGLRDLGWTEGKNIQLDYRYTAGDLKRTLQVCGGISCARARRHLGR